MTTADIIAMAMNAADSAWDVWNDMAGDMPFPTAEGAYEVVREMKVSMANDPDDALWDSMELTDADWTLFRAVYSARVAELSAEVAP